MNNQLPDKGSIMTESKKIYVSPDETIVLDCPNCGRQREVHVGSFRGKNRFNVKCCQRFQVLVEFRRDVRKKTELKGTYINQSQEDHKGILIINDLSVTGLSFTCYNLQRFKEGDELTIKFLLDDEHRTPIRKYVIVRDIREDNVGCEFATDYGFSFICPLGYYVMHDLP